MRKPTRQTLDTCITLPPKRRTNRRILPCINNDGHVLTALFLHTLTFYESNTVRFILGFIIPAVIRQPRVHDRRADEYFQLKSRIEHAHINHSANYRSRWVVRTNTLGHCRPLPKTEHDLPVCEPRDISSNQVGAIL